MTDLVTGTSAPDIANQSADWLEHAERFAGRGVSTRHEDQLIPRIYLLQQNSPQVIKRDSKYVLDAEPGDFYLKTALRPIRSGLTGVEVVPCCMRRSWVEFLPLRQGFVTEHDQPPPDLESQIVSENDIEKVIYVRRSTKNVIVDTRTFYLLVEGSPYVFGCSSTLHTFAREWNSYQLRLRHPQTGAGLPAFAHKYLLVSIPASNAKGKWFSVRFQDLGPASIAEMEAGNSLYEAVARGTMRGEMPSNGETAF
jgi:hypothetical protein